MCFLLHADFLTKEKVDFGYSRTMPELRNGKSYSNDEACAQQFHFEKGFLIKSSLTPTMAKTITTHQFLLSIHKKIQMHLMSEKPLSHLKMRKLIRMLNKMDCASPRDRKYLEAAQKILCQLYFNASNSSNVEITDKGTGTENLLSISQASSQELTILAMEEKENVSINSQAPNVMNLKYDYAQNDDDENFSFPLELLTNVNFMDTQKSTDSGLIQQHIDQLSDITFVESTQNKSVSLVSDNPLVISCLTQSSKNVSQQSSDTGFNEKTYINNNECKALSMMKISRNIPFDAQTDTSYSTNVSSTTLINTASFETNFEAVPKETIWKKPSTNCLSFRNTPLSVQKMPVNSSNTENISHFQRNVHTFSEGTMWKTPTSISNVQSIVSTKFQISDFQLPSEGSCWKEANVRISQATSYDFNDSNVPEIFSLDTDTTITEKIVIDDDGDSHLAEESPNTDVIECSQNINEIPLEKIMNNDNEGDNESFVFNLTRANSTVTVIEATPFAAGAQDILNENLKTTLSKTQLLKATPFPQTSAINETEEVIIDETGYFNSDSTIINKHGVSSPYRSRTQSNSFLNYKVSGRSSRSSSSRRRQNSKSGKREFHRGNEEQAFSENLVFIDGVIHKKREQMDCNPPAKAELSYLESQKMLEEEILKKRNAYKAKWKDMSISDKISAKFANKFHVRIFEDPVESLINISYKPNFNNVHFPRITVSEMHEQLKPTWEIAKKMDTALVKVVRELVEKNNADFTFNLPRRADNDTDSDSSDVENEANTRWLKNYFANTKNEIKEFMNDTHKEQQKAEAVYGNKRELFQYRGCDDVNDQLENVLKAMNDFDWLKE